MNDIPFCRKFETEFLSHNKLKSLKVAKPKDVDGTSASGY